MWKEIFPIEEKEFGDRLYFLDLEIGWKNLKWILNSKILYKRRLHFLQSITQHRNWKFFLAWRAEKVNNYKLFENHKKMKIILHDVKYNMDDIVVILSPMKCYIVLG